MRQFQIDHAVVNPESPISNLQSLLKLCKKPDTRLYAFFVAGDGIVLVRRVQVVTGQAVSEQDDGFAKHVLKIIHNRD